MHLLVVLILKMYLLVVLIQVKSLFCLPDKRGFYNDIPSCRNG